MRLETAQERNAVTALSLQRPVAVKPLHELTLPLHRQVTGDLTQPKAGDSTRSGHTRASGALCTLHLTVTEPLNI